MQLLILNGASNTGKTTTINYLFDKLISDGAKIENPKSTLGGDPKDFEAILLYKGKRIGLFSMGDYSNQLSNAITKYDSTHMCDFFIFALSNNKAMINANKKIRHYTNPLYNLKMTSKNAVTQDTLNHQDADSLKTSIK